ncbi:DUF11 domain-containing protein [Leucobacter chromiireducens]|uniref:DUF7927 domain-containing protein n=1 Tax=Leucobacter chromiireducens TaxID=283877 RepID=UPI0013DDC637|nr:DUF11 domain-containing protein [Leucobacter chromiireducens]
MVASPAFAVMTDGPTGFTDRPGVAKDPAVLYSEDFENVADPTGPYTPLVDYVSEAGIRYTADPFWADSINACNGFVASGLSDFGHSCGGSLSTQGGLRQLADTLGQLNGSDPQSNSVLSAYTGGPRAAGGLVQFATVGEPISAPAPQRFITFSVNAAATSCWAAHPSLSFSYVSNGVEVPIDTGSPIDPCSDPRAQQMTPTGASPELSVFYAGTFTSAGSFLSDGADFGIVMRNGSGQTAGNDGAVDDIRVLDVTPHLNKEFAPERVEVGSVSTLTFTVTNTSELASNNGWAFTDTLREGLRVADSPNITNTCDADVTVSGAGVIEVKNGDLAEKQATCEISLDVTSDSPRGAEASPVVYVNNAADIRDVIGLDVTNETTVEFFSAPKLSIEKTSDADQNARVGQTVNYEVNVTNTGTADFTSAHPARLDDDLADVLDDATYNNDVDVSFSDGSTSAAPVVADGKLTWSGPLKVGETATFAYSVTLNNAGNGEVVNNACVPADLSSGESNCASTTTELPKLVIAKSSDVSDLPENGGKVTYQVTITNQGPGDATAQNPASFVDDLSEVLDDGDFVDESLSASMGTATRDGNELSWSGPLAASESVTVTYEIEYDSAKGGDHALVNVACLPADLAADPDRLCRQVQVPGAALQQWKTADPASGAVAAGDEITYTLHFRNTGQAAVDINNSDDLAEVIDDADLIAGPTSSSGNLTAAVDGNTIRLGGSVAAGAEETVRYTVKVRAFADRGDSVLTNALATCEANDTALCDPVVHQVPHLIIEKSSDVSESRSGDTVTYTIRVTNDGTAAYTEQSPATFVDDLTGVLDDATFNDDAKASVGSVSYATPELSWEGPLAPNESATITYSVDVTSAGDHRLLNTVCAPVAGETAACDDNTVLLPNVLVTKSVDPESGTSVQPGQTVTYTLSFGNDGLAPAAIDYTDDLSDVLDDAEFGTGPTVSDPSLAAVKTGEEIGITGDIAPGQTVTVSYTAVVKADGERGNNVLGNVLAHSGTTDPECGDDGVSCTENPIGELLTWKTVDPASGATLRAGDNATYTLHFENTGKADVTVNHDDVLTQVQDDADITVQPEASGAALSASEIAEGRFTVTGTLGAGESATASYTVRVKADGERGDDRLANFLVPQGEQPPASCEVAKDQLPNCTVNHVSDVTVVKSSDPESGTRVNPGDDVTYTLMFTNLSMNSESAPVAVDYTDHMKNVLDDATLVKEPSASSASLDAEVSGDTIRVRGDVAAGDVVTVTYTVRVKAYAEQGDHTLENVVAVTGETPVCVDGSGLCTTHDVPPVKPTPPGLALTGSDSMLAVGATVLAGLMVGAGAMLFTRRRKSGTEETSSLV